MSCRITALTCNNPELKLEKKEINNLLDWHQLQWPETALKFELHLFWVWFLKHFGLMPLHVKSRMESVSGKTGKDCDFSQHIWGKLCWKQKGGEFCTDRGRLISEPTHRNKQLCNPSLSSRSEIETDVLSSLQVISTRWFYWNCTSLDQSLKRDVQRRRENIPTAHAQNKTATATQSGTQSPSSWETEEC